MRIPTPEGSVDQGEKLRAKDRECEFDCLNVMGWESIWRWQDWQDQLFHEQLARFHSTRHHILHHHGDILHHHQHQDHSLDDRCFEFSWLDKYLMKVTSHASSPGPVPPLLGEGVECSGKTTLLMRWINQYHERSSSSLVLSYSVVDQSHPSGDPSIVLKCLMFQIMRCFSTPFALVLDPGQLVRDFPKWLEKVSMMFPGGVVLVLGSVDRVKNFEVIFDWLMDPLPVDLRVIVSLRNDACPPSWRSWPLLSIDPMTESEVRECVDLLECDSSKFNKDVVLAHLLNNPSLCLPLSARLVASLSMLGVTLRKQPGCICSESNEIKSPQMTPRVLTPPICPGRSNWVSSRALKEVQSFSENECTFSVMHKNHTTHVGCIVSCLLLTSVYITFYF